MRRALIILLGLASAAAYAGTVEVQFIKPETYTDARDGLKMSRDDVLKVFEQRLKQLGEKRLPASQTLHIEVLDVDLAGDTFPRVRLQDTRVLRGRADWPRMHLRYTLKDGDQVVKSGDEQIADMNYLMSGNQVIRDEPYPYEKRMLERWFNERIVAAR